MGCMVYQGFFGCVGVGEGLGFRGVNFEELEIKDEAVWLWKIGVGLWCGWYWVEVVLAED